jgi:hypothetical protein
VISSNVRDRETGRCKMSACQRVIVDRTVQAIKIIIDIVGSAAAFRAGECQA